MKIYTKTGDDGKTGLLAGARVGKGDPRIECIGEVDELNAVLGVAALAADAALGAMLRRVQNELFVIGSHLAAGEHSAARNALPPLDNAMVSRLEAEIDAAEAYLPELRQFILPGGSEAGARLHLARAVCRRAERSVIRLHELQAQPPLLLAYLNRLSDWLFVQARLANHSSGAGDVVWQK